MNQRSLQQAPDRTPLMPHLSDRMMWIALAAIAIIAAIVVLVSPAEQTLGRGIRAVYVHVGLTWTGTAVFVVTALLGLGVLLTANPRFVRWMRPAGWTAVGFYAAGISMSMVASVVNWGNLFLQEPRMNAAINTLTIGIILQLAGNWFPWPRLHGLFNIIFIGLLFWLTYQVPLVLHPRDPIGTSSSNDIRYTFLILFGLFSVAAAAIVWRFAQKGNSG